MQEQQPRVGRIPKILYHGSFCSILSRLSIFFGGRFFLCFLIGFSPSISVSFGAYLAVEAHFTQWSYRKTCLLTKSNQQHIKFIPFFPNKANTRIFYELILTSFTQRTSSNGLEYLFGDRLIKKRSYL